MPKFELFKIKSIILIFKCYKISVKKYWLTSYFVYNNKMFFYYVLPRIKNVLTIDQAVKGIGANRSYY